MNSCLSFQRIVCSAKFSIFIFVIALFGTHSGFYLYVFSCCILNQISHPFVSSCRVIEGYFYDSQWFLLAISSSCCFGISNYKVRLRCHWVPLLFSFFFLSFFLSSNANSILLDA